MQLLIKKCDRCGAVIEEVDYKNDLENILTSTISFFDGKEKISYDVCDSCACQFLDWMKNSATVIQQEVALDEHIKKNQEKCEKLRNALKKCEKQSGWSNEVIAMARAHNESVERDLDLSEKQEQPATVPKIDKIKIKLKPGTHTYHIWTKEEDDFILHHSAGMTANDLACKFGVTVSAVSSRRYNLLHGKV